MADNMPRAGVTLTAGGKQEYLAALAQASQATAAFAKAAEDAAKRINKVGDSTDQASKKTRKAKESFAGLAKEVYGLAAAYGVSQVARFAIDTGHLAVQASKAKIGFEAFSGSAAAAAINLEALRRATNNSANDIILMQAASKLLGSGLAGNTQEAEQLARSAVILGEAFGGRGAAQSLDEFTRLLQNQSVELMDQFGLSSGRARAEILKLMAANKGLSRETAFTTVVLQQASEKVEQLEKAGFKAGTGVDQLTTAVTNLKIALAGDFGGQLNDLERGAAAFIRNNQDAIGFGASFAANTAILKPFADAWRKAADEARRYADAADAVAAAQANVNDDLREAKDLLRANREEIEKMREAAARVVGTIGSKVGNWFADISPDRPSISSFIQSGIDQGRQEREDRRAELAQIYADRRDLAERNRVAIADIERSLTRELQTINRDLGRQLVDIDRQAADRRAEIVAQFAERATELYQDYTQETIRAAQEQAREEARIARDRIREEARIVRDYARETARITQDRARDAQREARDRAREEQREAQDYARESQRALEDHLERLRQIDRDYATNRREAIRNRDGKALADATRNYREQRGEAERDFAVSERRRQEDYEAQQRERQAAAQQAERDRREQYEQEDRDREEAARMAAQDRQEAADEAQRDRIEEARLAAQDRRTAYDEAMRDLRLQQTRELQEAAAQALRQRQQAQAAAAQARADARAAAAQRLADQQQEYQAELLALQTHLRSMMEALRAYAEWRIAMAQWEAQAQAAAAAWWQSYGSGSQTPPPAGGGGSRGFGDGSTSSTTTPPPPPGGSTSGGGSTSQPAFAPLRPTSPFSLASSATVSPPARPTVGAGGGNVMNVVVNAPGATAATIDGIRQAVRQEMVPVVTRMTQAFTAGRE